ncbi:MAG TPA: hypothetical protein VNN74_04130 [Candidatus Micrarchaeia archaeon]|nr:hypothetical protein [Candidatus Micrarchaeia archaeon]
MLHLIAFIVIGVVIGAFFIRGTTGLPAAARVVAGLAGSLIGGFATVSILSTHATLSKYGSLLVAIVLALVFSLVATQMTGGARAVRR